MTDNALMGRGLEPSLTVNDVDQSIRFYRDGLGFTVVDEMKDDKGKVQGARFKAGDARPIAFAVTDPDGYKLTITAPE